MQLVKQNGQNEKHRQQEMLSGVMKQGRKLITLLVIQRFKNIWKTDW